MKKLDIAMMIALHVVTFIIAAFVIHSFKVSDPGLAFIMAGVTAVSVAIYKSLAYNNNNSSKTIKITIGSILLVVVVIEGFVSQQILGWMKFPDVTITFASIGTFIFPFVLYNTIEKTVPKKQDT